jgi:hypothetical protein
MSQSKRVALLLSAVIVGVGSFFAYRAIAKYRDLRETLSWIDQTYNPHEGGDNSGQGHGWEIHYQKNGKGEEEITQEFKATFAHDSGCNVAIHAETMPVGVWSEIPSVTTYTFNLRYIDPDSFKVKTYDLYNDSWNCADPEQVELFKLSCDDATIEFRTRDGVATITVDTVKTFTKLKGSDHELRSTSKTNKCWLIVDDVPYAQRLAKALKHGIELCGGKPSRF